MADAPQGAFYFPGIADVMPGSSFTLQTGAAPSIATLTCAPQQGFNPRPGTLVIRYGYQTLSFPDCKIDRIDLQRGEDGRFTWQVFILDRRWKWKFGQISGRYNVRRGSEEIDPATQKSTRELGEMCLKAMGEKGYNAQALPDDQFPEVDWAYKNPAQALDELCQRSACLIVLGLDNRVRIERIGEGARLPELRSLVLDAAITVDPSEVPSELVHVSAPIRYQDDLELEAVAPDVDGEIKPIDELSYKPREGWGVVDIPHFLNVADEKARELAKANVFQLYRIVTGFKIPGENETIDSLDRILPLENRQVERLKPETPQRFKGATLEQPFLPPWVYGVWNTGDDAASDNVEKPSGDLNEHPEGQYTRGFAVDVERGLVKFNEHVFRYPDNAEPNDRRLLEAWLYLRIAYSVRDKDTGAWRRSEHRRRLSYGTAGTQPEYFVNDEISPTVIQRYGDDGQPAEVETNESEVEKEAKYQLDLQERRYQLRDPASVSYAGFIAINPDGAIRQVTWSIDGQGFARTRASRNREELIVTLDSEERRRNQKVLELLKEANKTPAQQQRILEKA